MSVLMGAASRLLEADLRDWVSRHHLVLWLDLDCHYVEFVQQLREQRQRGELQYAVHTFAGSFLELLIELDSVTGGVDPPRVVIHLPGFNEELIRSTPLLELYKAGARYRKALETLIRDAAAGKIRPDVTDEYLQRSQLSLTAADVWLHDLTTTGEEGLASQLRDVTLTELVDDLLLGRSLAQRISAIPLVEASGVDVVGEGDPDRRAIRDRIVALTGMSESWFDSSLQTSFSSVQEQTSAEAVAYAICSWAACVSYVHDLLVPPRTRFLEAVTRLPQLVRTTCHELIVHLQNGSERQQTFYRRMAQDCESRLTDDVGQIAATDLGRFDTFGFEEETVLKASLQALQEANWPLASDWSARRSDPDSFWLRREPLRRNAWQLVAGAAKLGTAIAAAGTAPHSGLGLAAAVDEYVRVGAAVDQAHRHLMQDRQKLWRAQIPESDAIRTVLDQMQQRWCDWAGAWASGFSSVCRTHGYLPDSAAQQRTLFEDVVKPLANGNGPTAFFVVDAFRYEMGQELLASIGESAKTDVRLDWRLAELPTVTEVGMNVLAPVSKGGKLQLHLAGGRIAGFGAGEFRVADPETRRRSMHTRIGGRTCPRIDLDEVLRLEPGSLKRKIAGARMVLVHSREIDSAGEAGFGPAVFETVLKDLRSAWHLLRESGIQNFVFTADHGFLLLREESHPMRIHGSRSEAQRRYVLSETAAYHTGEVTVPLRDLGYDCEDLQLMMPDDIAVFDTGKQRKGFAHGGNSLQERVIPVLTLCHRTVAGGGSMQYSVQAVRREAVAGMHCLSATVELAAGSLAFTSMYELDLAVRTPEAPEVAVELCEVRGGARRSAGTLIATVGEEFELFFRLSGEQDARVTIELYHPGGEENVQACRLRERFDVTGRAAEPSRAAEKSIRQLEQEAASQSWLAELPEGAVRDVFLHLSQFGAVTEPEVMEMLGGGREFRRFSRAFERYAECVPFRIRIDHAGSMKRYVREGMNG